VIKDCANRYFLSFVVEIKPIQTQAENSSIGIDLGIKTFAVMSNGEKAESPTYKDLGRKVRKLKRKLTRQLKDSQRREITRIKIAKLHNQIADTRQDFLHKLSTQIVSENQVIVWKTWMYREWLKIGSYQGWLVNKDGENLGRSVRLRLKNLVESL